MPPRRPRSAPKAPENAPEVGHESTSDDGVDLTLIRWMLSLTPTERLAAAQDMADAVVRDADDRSSLGSPSTSTVGAPSDF